MKYSTREKTSDSSNLQEVIEPKSNQNNQEDVVSKQDTTMAMLIYLLSFFTAIFGPLIIWLIKRQESDFVDYHGKEYFNFFISYTVYFTVAGSLTVVLIGFIILPILGLVFFIFTIVGLIKSLNGERYRIPFIFRLIK